MERFKAKFTLNLHYQWSQKTNCDY